MTLGTQVGLGPGHIVLDGEPAPPSPKRGQSPTQIFGPCLLWPNGWMNQDGTWHGDRPRSRPHCARWGPSTPPQKGTEPLIFGTCLLWPNDWMDEEATWYRSRPHCIRRGSSPPRERGTAVSLFSAHVSCDHGCPSQLLLSSCLMCSRSRIGVTAAVYLPGPILLCAHCKLLFTRTIAFLSELRIDRLTFLGDRL